MSNQNKKIVQLAQMALLLALVVVLQLLGSFIKIGPLPMSFVLVPIVIGACLLGVKAGAILGFAFGLVTMIAGITGFDQFSFMLWQTSPFWFIVICLLKATLAGFGSGLVYKAFDKLFDGKNKTVTTVIASISAPIINTGIFCLGMLLFFFDTASGLTTALGQPTAVKVIFLGLAGFNFVGEFAVNLILSPAIVRIIDIVGKKMKLGQN